MKTGAMPFAISTGFEWYCFKWYCFKKRSVLSPSMKVLSAEE